MEHPETASWGLSISDADFAKLKRGVRPRDMDDRWIFQAMTCTETADYATAKEQTTDATTTDTEPTHEELMDAMLADEAAADEALADEDTLDLVQGGNISIHRSWTNKELYRLDVRLSEGATSAKIEAITWE
ncbi:unnamed protein product [Discula destructiva]